YATRYRNYWKSQQVPYKKISLFFGLTLQRILKPFHLVDQELYKKHGRLFGVFEDGLPTLYVADPDLVKLVLVADSGSSERKDLSCDDLLFNNMLNVAPLEKWKTIRAALSPLFTASKLRKMHDLVQECVINLTETLTKTAREGVDIDPKQFFTPCALELITRCTFGKEMDCGPDAKNDIVRSPKHGLFVPTSLSSIGKCFCFISVLVQKFMDTMRTKFIKNEAFYFYKKLCINTVDKKQLDINVSACFGFLNIVYKKSIYYRAKVTLFISAFVAALTKTLSEEETLAQCIFFHLAGIEAISAVTALVSYYLAVNPDIQATFQDEADACFARHVRINIY
ncbi:unnamed protein product, partial [Ixodes hexagonus]